MKPHYSQSGIDLYCGDCRDVLADLDAGSVQCCITSPPYWGLRDYGTAGQLGLESTPEEYVAGMVEVFRAVRRVLRDDGTVWLNLGDSYATNRNDHKGGGFGGTECQEHSTIAKRGKHCPDGLKMKDLCGTPWRVAFALQADGWYLRQDIIWHKPNPMPESVTDRCTKSHEYVFLLTKSARYFYDAEAVKEEAAYGRGTDPSGRMFSRVGTAKVHAEHGQGAKGHTYDGTRNRRSVWTIATQPYSEAHFATFPTALVEPCLLAGTSAEGCCPECGAGWTRVVEKVPTGEIHKNPDGWDTEVGAHSTIHRDGRSVGEAGVPVMTSKTLGWKPGCECTELGNIKEDDPGHQGLHDGVQQIHATPIPCTVLDPFFGAGTVGVVAFKHGRRCIGIDLSGDYCDMAAKRIGKQTAQAGLFTGAMA